MRLKTTLEQWMTLFEIERAGSIQAAAGVMNKSHTTLIYAVRKLEDQLGVDLVQVQGRRAVLTEDGRSLLRRASAMLEQAQELEQVGEQLSQGVESELTIAMDHLCDPQMLYRPLAEYLKQNQFTSVQVVETSLSKTTEMVTSEEADIAIINLPVTNYPAEAFGLTSMLPVVSVNHPLAAFEKVCMAELSGLAQIVIRDLGDRSQGQDVGWLKSSQRITVDNFDHALRAAQAGLGYSRLPRHIISQAAAGSLKVLEVEQAQSYQVPLHITLPKGAKTGPAARCLYDFLVRNENPEQD